MWWNKTSGTVRHIKWNKYIIARPLSLIFHLFFHLKMVNVWIFWWEDCDFHSWTIFCHVVMSYISLLGVASTAQLLGYIITDQSVWSVNKNILMIMVTWHDCLSSWLYLKFPMIQCMEKYSLSKEIVRQTEYCSGIRSVNTPTFLAIHFFHNHMTVSSNSLDSS